MSNLELNCVTRIKMNAEGTPAASQAMALALAPGILDTPRTVQNLHAQVRAKEDAQVALVDELSSQIVGYKSEIEALNAEIEAIYTLVMAHEDEVSRFLEARNLETSALKVQLHAAGHTPAETMAGINQKPLLAITKNGQRLMTETSFRKPSSFLLDESGTPRDSGDVFRQTSSMRPEQFNQLSTKLAGQSMAIEQGSNMTQEHVVALQQSRIRELEDRLTAADKENTNLMQERDSVRLIV
jgi:SMC interacting uncharacterized protein involved in chromosome segregation